MKIKLIILLLLMPTILMGNSYYLGVKDSSEQFLCPISLPANTSGIQYVDADSFFVIVRHSNASVDFCMYEYDADDLNDTCQYVLVDTLGASDQEGAYFVTTPGLLDSEDTITLPYTMYITIVTWNDTVPTFTEGILDVYNLFDANSSDTFNAKINLDSVIGTLADGNVDDDILGQNPPTNWADMAITITSGEVDAKLDLDNDVSGDWEPSDFNGMSSFWNEGKTGYSLSDPQSWSLTGNITGNLSGSVGSVTGSVGSVAGNVDGSVGSVSGNVSGSVASVVAAVDIQDSIIQQILDIYYFLGAGDDCYLIWYPSDGSRYKDSVQTKCGGSIMATQIFYHNNDSTVLDTAQTKNSGVQGWRP